MSILVFLDKNNKLNQNKITFKNNSSFFYRSSITLCCSPLDDMSFKSNHVGVGSGPKHDPVALFKTQFG